MKFKATPYFIINILLFGALLCVFVYAAIFSPEGAYPIPSVTRHYTSLCTVSTGLSRSFSALIRGNIMESRIYNPYGWRLFLFFLTQLFFRFTAILVLLIKGKKIWLFPDIAFALAGFIIAFWPFLLALARAL